MEKQLKILLIMPFFYPHRGGSQKYAEDIYSSIMTRHSNVTVDVITYNTDKKANYEKYKNFTIYRVPCLNLIPSRFTLPNPFILLKLLNTLSSNNYDIVNTHIRFFDPTWWAWKYAKHIGAKSFFTGHVATHPVHQNKLVELIAKYVDRTIAKYSLKRYDLITYVSNTTKEFFEYTLGVKRNKGHIIYGSVDTFYFTSKKEDERLIPNTDLHVTKDKVIVTYIGRVIWTKGITYLYEAIKKLPKEISDKCIFVIGGPGELEKTLKENISNDKLEEKVILTGNLNYEQVRELLAISDIYINPSHHSEGFPITILEAGASECFVIATDNAGTKEIIETEKTGILIKQKNIKDIMNSIIWAVEHQTKRMIIAKKLRDTIKTSFDIKTNAEKLYQLLLK